MGITEFRDQIALIRDISSGKCHLVEITPDLIELLLNIAKAEDEFDNIQKKLLNSMYYTNKEEVVNNNVFIL